jgi:hypothetical protein
MEASHARLNVAGTSLPFEGAPVKRFYSGQLSAKNLRRRRFGEIAEPFLGEVAAFEEIGTSYLRLALRRKPDS